MGFSEQLKKARLNMNYTQQEVADLMGITKSTYCGYETGKRQPDVAKIKQLATILNTSGDILLETGFEDITSELIPQKFNNFVLTKKDEIELLADYRTLNDSTKVYVRGVAKGFSISEKIANAKGETLTFPKPANFTKEFTDTFNEFNPEYQQAILEFVQQLLAEQEESPPHNSEK